MISGKKIQSVMLQEQQISNKNQIVYGKKLQEIKIISVHGNVSIVENISDQVRYTTKNSNIIIVEDKTEAVPVVPQQIINKPSVTKKKQVAVNQTNLF